METSIIINSTKDGKKYQKSIAKINPEKDNATLNEFAGMVNALSTNTFQGGSRVDKSSLSEQGGGSSGSSKQEGIITLTEDGDGHCTLTAYNGDAEYIYKASDNNSSDSRAIIVHVGDVFEIPDGYWIYFFTLPTANYTAACASAFYID